MKNFKYVLYNDIDFLVGVERKRVKRFGNISLCLGDTEGQQQIGGFKVGVGVSLDIICEIISNYFVATDFCSRDIDSHNNQCKLIEENNGNVKDDRE